MGSVPLCFLAFHEYNHYDYGRAKQAVLLQARISEFNQYFQRAQLVQFFGAVVILPVVGKCMEVFALAAVRTAANRGRCGNTLWYGDSKARGTSHRNQSDLLCNLPPFELLLLRRLAGDDIW